MSASAPTRPSAPRRRSRSSARSGTPLLIHQPSYSLLNRWIEDGLLDVLERHGVGAIVFSPLAQGLLTDRYLDGIPEDSRVRRGEAFSARLITEENLARVRALNEIAVAARADPRPAGDRLGPARRARQLGADRREQRRPARAERRGARRSSSSAPTSWPRSTAAPPTAGSTSGRPPATPERARPAQPRPCGASKSSSGPSGTIRSG